MNGNKILYVEDDRVFAELYAEQLRSIHFEVECVYRGKSAYDKYKEINPDLILVDLELPDCSGYEIIDQIRKEDNATPIFIFSSQLSSENAIKGYACGCSDCIRKGMDMKEFLMKINKWREGIAGNKLSLRITKNTFIDKRKQELHCFGTITRLSFKEMNLLINLVINKNIPQGRQTLAEYIWRDTKNSMDNMDKCITKLRKLLAEDSEIYINAKNKGLIALGIGNNGNAGKGME